MLRLILSLIPLLLLFIIGFALGLENSEPVAINLLFVQKTLPMSTVIAGSLGVGFFFGVLATVIAYLRLKVQNRRLRSELQRLKKAKV